MTCLKSCLEELINRENTVTIVSPCCQSHLVVLNTTQQCKWLNRDVRWKVA